jgi:lysozyme family protein
LQNLKELAKIFAALEGRFSDDPDDLGGVTKYGVTLATLE